VNITDLGLTKLKEIDRQVEQTAKDLFSNLTTTEMGQLNTLLDKVRT
jgi:hypothetical protein